MALQFALNRLFVVTANLGSVFEDGEVEENWMIEFEKLVEQADPDLVALHCQEIGGKDFGTSMGGVEKFVMRLRALKCFENFNRMRGWFDTNFKQSDSFTALGNLYLIHQRVEPAFLWNFTDKEFKEVTGDQVVYDNLQSDHYNCKKKFPEDFYPGVRWSRKGYLHTRWKMFGSRVLNLINIHLFHDDDNLIALEKSPSVYSKYRKQALKFAMESVLRSIEDSSEPLYIYGDFNFRLDFSAVVQHLMTSEKSPIQLEHVENGPARKMVYRCEGRDFMTIERKRFLLPMCNQFTEKYKELMKYDQEPSGFEDLKELPLDFQPSYPFSEEVTEGAKYMDKRCPGWCDRILMNEAGLKIVVQSPLGCMYNMMAKTVCVGDHKPIYLFFTVASTTPMKELSDENLDA